MLQSVTSEMLLAAYLAFCILTTVIVYSFRALDHRPLSSGHDDDYEPVGFFERPDRAIIMLTFGILGVAFLAYLGWRLPQEIQRIAEGQSSFRLFTAVVNLDSLGRGAQVVGAVSFGLIALRLMRFSMMLAFVVTMLALAFAAYGYVFS